MEQTATGTMDASDTYPCCDVCGYVDWDRRTEDGDDCPKCAGNDDD